MHFDIPPRPTCRDRVWIWTQSAHGWATRGSTRRPSTPKSTLGERRKRSHASIPPSRLQTGRIAMTAGSWTACDHCRHSPLCAGETKSCLGCTVALARAAHNGEQPIKRHMLCSAYGVHPRSGPHGCRPPSWSFWSGYIKPCRCLHDPPGLSSTEATNVGRGSHPPGKRAFSPRTSESDLTGWETDAIGVRIIRIVDENSFRCPERSMKSDVANSTSASIGSSGDCFDGYMDTGRRGA